MSILDRFDAGQSSYEQSALRGVLADREAELLEIKGPCSVARCRLHYAHRGPCDIQEARA